MEYESIFIDTSFLIALHNPDDPHNAQALSLSKTFKHVKLVISSYIILEAATVLSQRAGKRLAVEACNMLLSSKNVEVIHISEDIFQSSWEVFARVSNKDMSFVDASVLTVVQSYGVRHLATFDKDFIPFQKQYDFSIIASEDEKSLIE